MVKKTLAVIVVGLFFTLSSYLIGYEIAEQPDTHFNYEEIK